MRIDELRWRPRQGWLGKGCHSSAEPASSSLVLYFGPSAAIAASSAPATLAALHPGAMLFGCSTAASILDDVVDEEGVVAVVCCFDATTLRLVETDVADAASSGPAGRQLGEALCREPAGRKLAGVILLSDGVRVDGGALALELQHAVGVHVPVSGGLAADGAHFAHTVIGVGAAVRPGRAAALGLYGDAVRLSHGSAGGWAPFGPRRRITRSSGCVLHELDGKPALELYERYLGDEAADLPGSALLFPLLIWDRQEPTQTQVRTVLGIDREHGTMTFAGSVPEGWGAQLMRGSLDRLVAGASSAGEMAHAAFGSAPGARPSSGDVLGLLVSCVGRHLLLGQRVDEELRAVGEALGTGITRIGFYSHGEIAPDPACGISRLQNQTMAVTLLSEAP